MIQIFQIIILIFSAIIHEYMHGFVADRLGDPTARQAGRLTLNPIPHIDLFGSIIMPGLMLLFGTGFIFAWAKPVPINPYNLRNKKHGEALVAAAGPLANFILAISFGLVLRFFSPDSSMSLFLGIIVYINLLLGIFNLVPIPPLDGSRILATFLPYHLQQKFYQLERYGMFLVLLFVMFGFNFIYPVLGFLFKIITGFNLA